MNDSACAPERPPDSPSFCKEGNFKFFSVLRKLNMWFSNLPSLYDHIYLLYNYIYSIYIDKYIYDSVHVFECVCLRKKQNTQAQTFSFIVYKQTRFLTFAHQLCLMSTSNSAY